jgi:hypothetical protein
MLASAQSTHVYSNTRPAGRGEKSVNFPDFLLALDVPAHYHLGVRYSFAIPEDGFSAGLAAW